MSAAEIGQNHPGSLWELQRTGIPPLSDATVDIFIRDVNVPIDTRRDAKAKEKLRIHTLNAAWKLLDEYHPALKDHIRDFISKTDSASQPVLKQTVAEIYLAIAIQRAVDAGISVTSHTSLPAIPRDKFFPQVDFHNKPQARLFDNAQVAAVHHLQDVSNDEWASQRNAMDFYMQKTNPYLSLLVQRNIQPIDDELKRLQPPGVPLHMLPLNDQRKIAKCTALKKNMMDVAGYVFVALQDEQAIFQRALASGDQLQDVRERRRRYADQEVGRRLQPPSYSVSVPENLPLAVMHNLSSTLQPSFYTRPGSSIRENEELSFSQQLKRDGMYLLGFAVAAGGAMIGYLRFGGDPQTAANMVSNMANAGPFGFLSSIQDIAQNSLSQTGALIGGTYGAIEWVFKHVVNRVIRPLLYPERKS